MMSVYYCDSTGVKYFYTLLYNNFTTRLSAIKNPLPSLKDSITLHQKIRDAYRSESDISYFLLRNSCIRKSETLTAPRIKKNIN